MKSRQKKNHEKINDNNNNNNNNNDNNNTIIIYSDKYKQNIIYEDINYDGDRCLLRMKNGDLYDCPVNSNELIKFKKSLGLKLFNLFI